MNNRMESIYVGAAKDVLGIAKRTSKPWLHDGAWKKVEERRHLKLNLESTRSERVKKRIKEEYKGKDQEVKRSAREDKRYWMNEMADIAERAAENGRAGEVHRVVKTLAGEKSSIGVGGTRAFFKNDLLPTQLYTTFHIMASYLW